MKLNQISVNGEHFQFSVMQTEEEVRNHPEIEFRVILFGEEAKEIEFRHMGEHSVVRAYVTVDGFELVAVEHVGEHESPEEDDSCKQHPFLVLAGGRVISEGGMTKEQMDTVVDAFVLQLTEEDGQAPKQLV